MSVRYSHSPVLNLRIANSRVRDTLLLLLGAASLWALYLLWQQGYLSLALMLLPVVVLLLYSLRKDGLNGCQLCWYQGRWSLVRGSSRQSIAILPRSTWVPGLIYLAWQESPRGGRGWGFIFADALSTGQLRQLRVRLALEH